MKYIAIAVVAFGPGTELGLTEAQARARKHAITPIANRKGWYISSGPLQLKAGEAFHYDGDLPKGMADLVEGAKKAKAPPAGDAAARAKQLQAATEAVAAAEAALAAAADADKAAAEQALADAQAALEALKG